MKQLLSYSIIIAAALVLFGCKKTYEKYPGGEINPNLSIYDLRTVFKGSPVTLSEANMFGSTSLSGVVTSDHSGNNMPPGLVVIQNRGRFNELRSMAINIGNDAASYIPGDSVIINVAGGVMQRVNGVLQITGINNSAITKVASGKNVFALIVSNASDIAANPDVYENALVTITQAEIDPPASAGATFSGDIVINDGSGQVTIHTGPGADYASRQLPFLATYIGILFSEDSGFKVWPRGERDIIVLSETPPKISPVIITGYLNNAFHADQPYEYVQLMATRDIDFAVTNMAVIFCNNAGTAGAPVKGWVEGGVRSYKFNLTSGTAKKGTYFYVGGSGRLIAGVDANGNRSTDISSANWIASWDYSAQAGSDGIGNATTGLMANSGNPAGIAVFDTKDVTPTTEPVDVLFYGMTSNNNTFAPGNPPRGYYITNTDYYETQNTTVPTLDPQPYYLMGTNLFKFVIVNDENFRSLGGTYNTRSGKWTVKRSVTPITLTLTSQLSEIEGRTTLTEQR